ncbi:MAG TPA: hypothetical protein VNR20_03100 [Terriglobales bacterium]|nr:hypothetical protein [Terriglobales bacterium]
MHRVEPVKEVEPKLADTDEFAQILVRSKYDASGARDRSRTPEPLKRTFLQHAQQFDLDHRRQFSDLVQE